MSSELILTRLRQYLLIISAGVFIMTLTELIFLSHWTETIQFLPFGLSALGLITLALAYFRPSRAAMRALRVSMLIVGACSFIGFYEHMANNFAFRLEIQPNATPWQLMLGTLEGANPILAPGILLLGAVIGLLAIYRHPILES